MTLEEARYNLIKLTRTQKFVMMLDALLWAITAGAIVFMLTVFTGLSWTISLGIAVVIGVVVSIVRSRMMGLHTFDEHRLVRLINNKYKEYEESTDLLLADGNLTTLQQIQQSRTVTAFEQHRDSIRIPNKLPAALIAAIVAVAACIILYPGERSTSFTQDSVTQTVPEEKLPAAIKSVSINVTPPGYTGLKRFTSDKLNITIPEGSKVEWNVSFSEKAINPLVRVGSSDSLGLKAQQEKIFTAEYLPNESFIYQFTWNDATNTPSSSAYYTIEVARDQAPSIRIEELNQFTQFTNHCPER